MIIVPNKGLWVPKLERGFIIGSGFSGERVIQPDITVTQSASGQQVQCGIRFQQPGSSDLIDKDGNTQTRIRREWWSGEPEPNISDDYDVREASHTSGTWDFAAGGVGVWVNIATGKNWWVLRTFGKGAEGVGTDQAVGVFEIRVRSMTDTKVSFILDASATIL